MRHLSARGPALLATLLVATLAPAVLVANHHVADDPATDADQLRLAASRPAAHRRSPDSDPHTWQTSDRVIGPMLTTPRSSARRTRRTRPANTRATLRARYQVAPGVTTWSFQRRLAGRNLRYYVTRVQWRKRGVGFALAQPRFIDKVHKVGWLAHHTPHTVAAVNGDFFDIGDTGAPLGIGVRNGIIQHGINSGWNSAFWTGPHGRPAIGTLPLTVTSPQHPGLGLTNVDSPQVRPGGIGVYDARWRRTSGYRWTDGQKKDVLMAHVVGGRVADIATVYPAGTVVSGQYLVARGAQAVKRLRTLTVGSRFTVHKSMPRPARTAISGNAFLLQHGRMATTDAKELHPRTGVGIDYAHKRVWLIVVEGRQEFSDGVTMVQLARMFRHYRCTEALNLDGGGSSTLVAHAKGRLRVLNSPSDGHQRNVANGLAVTYRKPRRHR